MNEWYVVTAGHCVARARASQVRVTLGEYVLKSSAEPLPGRTYGVSRIKVHPYFKFTPQADRSVVSLASFHCIPCNGWVLQILYVADICQLRS